MAVDVRQQLTNLLFVGFSADSPKDVRPSTGADSPAGSDKYLERLLAHVRVLEEDEDRGKSDKIKYRYICVTVKKSMKLRVHKVKPTKAGGFSVSKSWGLDEIKSVESADDTQILVNLGKMYKWRMDDPQKKIDFLFTLLKLCRKYLKRQPKLINVDEELLRAQMQLNSSALSATEQEFAQTFATMAQRPRGVAFEEEDDDDDGPDRAESLMMIPMEVEAPAVNLDEVLETFNWHVSGDAAALEARLLTELHALEAANVHAIISSEEQANMVVNQLDQAILHLDQIDEWISHYTQLLDSMGQDVHQIEVRHKGMQIVSANQKLLLTEVEAILSSLRLPTFLLDVLRTEPLKDSDGIAACENATQKLMEVTQRKHDNDLGALQAVKDQIAFLNTHGTQFAVRLHDYLVGYFQQQAEIYLNDKSRSSRRGSLRLYGHDQIEEKLYRFCKLLKWLKGVDTRKHYNLQMSYVQEFARVYTREIHEFLDQFKSHHLLRRAEGEELDYMFTQPASVSSAASNAIKSAIAKSSTTNLHIDRPRRLSNVMRRPRGGLDHSRTDIHTDRLREDGDSDSQSVKQGHRRVSSEAWSKATSGAASTLSLDVGMDERLMPDEALGHTLALLCPAMVREQNFMCDLFALHKEGGSSTDLHETTADQPDDVIHDWQDRLSEPRPPIKDLKLTKRMQELLEGLFDETKEGIISLLENGLKGDTTFAVGMIVQVEDFLEEFKNTCHTYIQTMLEQLNEKLVALFEKFLEEQIKVIDDTKVTAKKRSGILPFVRTFPRFVDRMESSLGDNTGLAQQTVNKAYARIVQTMLETLDVMSQQVVVDTKAAADDKEFLNIHILHVENMHHFYSVIRARKVPSLDVYVKQTKSSYDSHLDAYCKVVIRKPLGKLYDFFEGIEGLLKTNTPEEINYHMQYNKGALKDVVRKYPGKEIKKSLESLYKRVEKHYTDEEGLLQVIWRGIQDEFFKRVRRYGELIAICYPESSIRLEFTMDELVGYFSELARAH
ncbi:Exocyst complex component 1 [Geranomyces michiganensis]|nr:Exocyst complex component 1 [Geranomyces michiganensis]